MKLPDEDQVTSESMEAAAWAEMATLRARGVPIPKDAVIEGAFKLGFAGGADWAMKLVRTTVFKEKT